MSIFSIGTWYAIFKWDIRLPSAMLSLVLSTTIVGNLISSKAGFVYAFISGVLLILFAHLTTHNFIHTDTSWQTAGVGIFDAIEIMLFILFTSGIAWISNQETSNSLNRARQSEISLLAERDNLEAKVKERTKEIEQIQIEKVSELYTFIEFGKISAGLIHDLMSPLNALCIEIDSNEFFEVGRNKPEHQNIKTSTQRLVNTGKKIQEIISTARNQIKVNLNSSLFSIKGVILEIISVNNHRTKKINAAVKIDIPPTLQIYGSESLFLHLCTNIISNSIDACAEKQRLNILKYKPQIYIFARKEQGKIFIRIKDNGSGIPKELANRIFDPFFSTKGSNGCGFGLAASKHVAEKYFNASLSLRSFNPKNRNEHFTEFKLEFPTINSLKTI